MKKKKKKINKKWRKLQLLSNSDIHFIKTQGHHSGGASSLSEDEKPPTYSVNVTDKFLPPESLNGASVDVL